MTTSYSALPTAPVPQAVEAPLTGAAIFLVVTVRPDEASRRAVRDLCADLPALVRGIAARDHRGQLTCVTGFGAAAWDTLFDAPRPAGLHPLPEFRGAVHVAPSTPGDVLFHVRAERMDLCFETVTQITARLDGTVKLADEVHGFQYFDNRGVHGFVDGTENPEGEAATEATLIGAEDPAFAGGSYVVVQKYLHDLRGWNALSVEHQEHAIGRTKLGDVELADKPANAHNALTIIEEDGREIKILRFNMPFGTAGRGEFGTYFIGYARSPAPIEQMLTNMFVGLPPGNHDRLLDFSTAMTGALFFVPSASLLDDLSTANPPGAH